MRVPRSLSALRERRFRLVFLSHAISVVGDNVVPVALAFAVLDLTGSISALGLVLLARILPMALLTLVGGVWADRVSRHGLMIATNITRCASQAVLGLLLVAGVARLWEIVALQAAHGAASAFYRPAWTGLIPHTIDRARLQQANALLFMALSAAAIIGPVIAGLLVATAGAGWAILLDAVSFAVAALLLMGLPSFGRVQPAGPRSFTNELAGGFAVVRSRSWLWVSIMHFALFQLVFMSTFPVLGPVVAKDSLGGASAWALIMAAFGVGTVIGGILALHSRPQRPLLSCFVLILGTVPSLVLLGLASPMPAIVCAQLFSGLAMSYCTTVWEATLQGWIPSAVLSRVAAYDGLGSIVLRPVGLALVGPIAAALTVRTTLLGSAAVLVVGTLAVLAVPSIRSLGRPSAEVNVIGGLEPAGSIGS